MLSNGYLLTEMQNVGSNLVVIVIDEIVDSDEYGVPMYIDPNRSNFNPIEDVTSAQQKVIRLAQTFNCPIYLIVSDSSFYPGYYYSDNSLSYYGNETKPSLRALLPGNTKIINKRTPNAFFETGLADRLEVEYNDPGNKNLVVMGYHANVCVKATVGLAVETKKRYPQGPGAIQQNFTVMTSFDVLNGNADWYSDHSKQILFYNRIN